MILQKCQPTFSRLNQFLTQGHNDVCLHKKFMRILHIAYGMTLCVLWYCEVEVEVGSAIPDGIYENASLSQAKIPSRRCRMVALALSNLHCHRDGYEARETRRSFSLAAQALPRNGRNGGRPGFSGTSPLRAIRARQVSILFMPEEPTPATPGGCVSSRRASASRCNLDQHIWGIAPGAPCNSSISRRRSPPQCLFRLERPGFSAFSTRCSDAEAELTLRFTIFGQHCEG